MNVNIAQMPGPWDAGYSLDKHTVKSEYVGDNEYGHAQFKTTRSPAGEALYQLKYRRDFGQVSPISAQMAASLGMHLASAKFVIPMPPSRHRARQPVVELARRLAVDLNIQCVENLVIKTGDTPQMKDIALRQDKVDALRAALTINDAALPAGQHDVIVVDDLFDSGASLEAITATLRTSTKVRRIYVATVTRKI